MLWEMLPTRDAFERELAALEVELRPWETEVARPEEPHYLPRSMGRPTRHEIEAVGLRFRHLDDCHAQVLAGKFVVGAAFYTRTLAAAWWVWRAAIADDIWWQSRCRYRESLDLAAASLTLQLRAAFDYWSRMSATWQHVDHDDRPSRAGTDSPEARKAASCGSCCCESRCSPSDPHSTSGCSHSSRESAMGANDVEPRCSRDSRDVLCDGTSPGRPRAATAPVNDVSRFLPRHFSGLGHRGESHASHRQRVHQKIDAAGASLRRAGRPEPPSIPPHLARRRQMRDAWVKWRLLRADSLRHTYAERLRTWSAQQAKQQAKQQAALRKLAAGTESLWDSPSASCSVLRAGPDASATPDAAPQPPRSVDHAFASFGEQSASALVGARPPRGSSASQPPVPTAADAWPSPCLTTASREPSQPGQLAARPVSHGGVRSRTASGRRFSDTSCLSTIPDDLFTGVARHLHASVPPME